VKRGRESELNEVPVAVEAAVVVVTGAVVWTGAVEVVLVVVTKERVVEPLTEPDDDDDDPDDDEPDTDETPPIENRPLSA